MTHFNFAELNIWAILAASVLNMLIGFIWYSKALFGVAWMNSLGFKEEDLKPSPWLFLIVFLLGVVIAVFMALFLQGVSCVWTGLGYGALLALVFVIPTMVTHYLYEMRSAKFMLIVVGHELFLFSAYGAILGGWQ